MECVVVGGGVFFSCFLFSFVILSLPNHLFTSPDTHFGRLAQHAARGLAGGRRLWGVRVGKGSGAKQVGLVGRPCGDRSAFAVGTVRGPSPPHLPPLNAWLAANVYRVRGVGWQARRETGSDRAFFEGAGHAGPVLIFRQNRAAVGAASPPAGPSRCQKSTPRVVGVSRTHSVGRGGYQQRAAFGAGTLERRAPRPKKKKSSPF